MKIVETLPLHTYYADENDSVRITCPACSTSQVFAGDEFKSSRRGIKAHCKCGHSFHCNIEFRRYYRKTVNFSGDYRQERTGESGKLTVECLSLGGLDFVNLTPQNLIMKNDILEVSFHLDDKNNTLIQRRAKVMACDDNMVNIAFVKHQLYDKQLGFYLMP